MAAGPGCLRVGTVTQALHCLSIHSQLSILHCHYHIGQGLHGIAPPYCSPSLISPIRGRENCEDPFLALAGGPENSMSGYTINY